jgi:hypothetical protein
LRLSGSHVPLVYRYGSKLGSSLTKYFPQRIGPGIAVAGRQLHPVH